MRRAISWEYCPPRSRTSTGRSASDAGSSRTSALASIVRRFLRDRDRVRVALTEAGAGDPDEFRLLQRFERRRAAVTHGLPDPSDELLEDVSERPLVRDAPLDPL